MELWHPAVVHFPVVLLPVALCFDAWAWLKGRADLHASAYALWAAGALAGLVAVLTGDAAAGAHGTAETAAAIEGHEDWATGGTLACLALVLVRLPLHLRRAYGARLALWDAAAALAVALMWYTAHRGGELVFTYGVGVAR